MEGDAPLVSVVIATYYRNELLVDAIESVLAQEYEPVELIVVDDSGEGHARPVLDEYEAVTPIVRSTNGDWAAAYTDGIEASSGTYIQLLDDDDYLLPGKLRKTVAATEEDPDVGVAYSGLEQDTLGPVRPDPDVRGDILRRALRFRTFPCCTITMLVDRGVLEPSLPLATHADDLNLKIELAARTRFDYVDECLAYRRKEAGRKWQGLAKIREMKACIEYHDQLYDRYPAIRRQALAETYAREGRLRLDQQAWSPPAIACFLRATHHSERSRWRFAGRAVAACFGRPGLDLARYLHDQVLDGRRVYDRGAGG